jgi:hypothetical protein
LKKYGKIGLNREKIGLKIGLNKYVGFYKGCNISAHGGQL